MTLARLAVVAAMVLSMFAGFRWPPVPGAILFMAAFWLTDQLDGWLARRLGLASSFGESLDLVVDRACDVLISAYLLQAAPRHLVAILIFLTARIAPDVAVARYGGLSPGMFAAIWRTAFPRLTRRAVWLAIEANSLAKAVFFCAALFWSSPGWSGMLLALPALVFAGLTALLLRDHASRTLAERGERRS